MSSYSTVLDHRSMVFDDLRNEFYANAISEAVGDDSVVLDLGAGLGLHGFIAARNGARKVYLVEPAAIINVSQKLVDANDLSEQVDCIRGNIEEIDLPEQVDVIISVFTGNFLLTEDLLPSLFYARDNYLKPGGRLIPDRAVMEVAPVSAPEYYAKHIDCWTDNSEVIDFGVARSFAVNSLYYDDPDERKAEFLSEPAEMLDLDFMTATEASCRSQVEVEVSQDGLCHGWLGWFRTRLGDNWLSTSPLEKQTHWRQVFLPLAEPVSVREGEILSFELIRPEFGEWTWKSGHGGKWQRHSTFLSEPVSPAELQRKSESYKPRLSERGRAAREVLERMSGNIPTADIVDHLVTKYEGLFPSREHAARFVKNLVEHYSP